MYKTIIAILLSVLLCGCSTTKRINVPEAGITVIDYGAHRRGAYLLKTNNGKQIIVSEPSPDVAKEITASLGLSASTIGTIKDPNLKAKYATNVVDLANRGQTLQVLREALFRLSEMGASSDISDEQRTILYSKVLDTIIMMEATAFANTDAPKEAKASLKNILSKVGRDTFDYNDN
ncbi:MAG: hypothetical protein ACYTE8_12280 [Planctomycetota bacterium]